MDIARSYPPSYIFLHLRSIAIDLCCHVTQSVPRTLPKKEGSPAPFFRAAVSCALAALLSCCSPQIHQFSQKFSQPIPPTTPEPKLPFGSLTKTALPIGHSLSPALGSPQPSLIGQTLQHPYILPSAFFPPATDYPALAPPFHKISVFHSKLVS